jgi:RHS repeat-associated protein
LKTSTDARNAITTYGYDALNRVTSAAYKIGSTTDQTISFTYDAGTFGKGRRTGASDANHSMSWVYSAQRRVTSKTQTVGTVAKSVGYAYTNGNLTTLTTPSGQTVVYGYNTNGQVVSITVNGTTLLSGVTYEPFGPIKGWTWGNGSAMSRTFDTDGKLTAIASGGNNKTYAFDDAFRITGITDTVTPANSYTYGFDSLDRLTSAVKTGTTRGWTYDANGNRLTETGASPSTYTISSSNNRVSSISGSVARTYTYNAAGSVLTYSNVTATYNNRGRMKSLKVGSTTANFTYNALGELVKRTGGTPGTVQYVYDEAGHLVGEYNSTGALIQETVWLGDTPVATLRPGTPVGVFYVHTDHLNTPRKITRPSDNAARWTWESDPFGSAQPNENPQSLGTFKYNLRFPGQLYDAHTGLNYNYFRDYDPVIGRYVESDPIGLRGGLNTYAYVSGNPLVWADPYGLDRLINPRPAGPNGPAITFNNDVPGGPSTNLPVTGATAAMIERAVAPAGLDININSTRGGTHSPTSRHPRGMACDINEVDGKRVDDATNFVALRTLQDAFNLQPNIRENFGPAITTRTESNGTVTPRPAMARTHQNHIHVSGQR